MANEEVLRALIDKVNSLESRLSVYLQRGLVTGTTEPAGTNQIVDVMTGVEEVATGLERIQEYGFTSHLPDNKSSEAQVLWLNGRRDTGFVIATDNRAFRLHVQQGEVAIYDDRGQNVHLTRWGFPFSRVENRNLLTCWV